MNETVDRKLSTLETTIQSLAVKRVEEGLYLAALRGRIGRQKRMVSRSGSTAVEALDNVRQAFEEMAG